MVSEAEFISAGTTLTQQPAPKIRYSLQIAASTRANLQQYGRVLDRRPMKRAALHVRVSFDAQQKEGIIEPRPRVDASRWRTRFGPDSVRRDYCTA